MWKIDLRDCSWVVPGRRRSRGTRWSAAGGSPLPGRSWPPPSPRLRQPPPRPRSNCTCPWARASWPPGRSGPGARRGHWPREATPVGSRPAPPPGSCSSLQSRTRSWLDYGIDEFLLFDVVWIGDFLVGSGMYDPAWGSFEQWKRKRVKNLES